MEIRFEHGIKETAAMQTEELRSSFLIEKLMQDDKIIYF